MRFGDYEVLPSNRWCYQVFKVMPEGFDNTKAKYRTAADGRALMPIECYPTSLADACAKVAGFAEKSLESAGDALEVEKRLRVLYDQISDAARRLEAAYKQKEANR